MFVVARTVNKRPSLMHLVNFPGDRTACGLDMGGWSRFYTETAIPAILCYKCAKKVN